MNYAMALEYQNCINCRACEVACKQENGVQMGADKQRIWVKMVENTTAPKLSANIYPGQCNQCLDAPCVEVCPTKASHYVEGGIVKITKDNCELCLDCVEACPYNARFLDDEREIVDKCSFCDHRIATSGTTACQSTCPTKVRTFGDLEDENSDIVQLLKTRRFFFEKEEAGTQPKLFYLLPENEDFTKQSLAGNAVIHTWDDVKGRYQGISHKNDMA